MKLEDLQPNAAVRGIRPDGIVTVVNVEWHGSDALTLVYRDASGRVADEVLYRDSEYRLEVLAAGRPWSFDGDGALLVDPLPRRSGARVRWSRRMRSIVLGRTPEARRARHRALFLL